MSYLDEEPRHGASIAAVVGGWGISSLVGGAIWLPALIAVLYQWLIRKFRPLAAQPLRWAIAFTLGQCMWMGIGGIAMPRQLPMVLPDIVIGLALSGWALARLSRLPLVLLILVQLAGLAINAMLGFQIGSWGPQMAALLAHGVLRSVILGFAVYALATGRLRQPMAEEDAEEVFA